MEQNSPKDFSVSFADADAFTFRRGDVVLSGLLVCAVLAVFWKVVFGGQMLFYRDILNQTYPEMKFVHEIGRQWILPYWNPYLNFGQPLLANPNSLVFYPTTLFILILPLDAAFTLHFVLHFALAAIGAYLLARVWGQSRVASFFAALLFVLSGPVLSLGSFYNEVAAAAWIPWALFLTDRALSARSTRRWTLLTIVFAMQFLAGEPFTLLATFILCLAYAFHRCGSPRTILSRPNRAVLLAFIASGALMLGLVAVQLIPATGLLGNSLRGKLGMPFSQTTYWSLHPLSVLEMLLPGFFGPMFSTPSLWTPLLNFSNKPFFPSLFVGFVPVFLASIAFAARGDRRRRFAAAAAVMLLLLSFGRFTPVFGLAYLLFPPLELVRFPIKLLVPFVLFVAVLAGWGIDDVRRISRSRHGRVKNLVPTCGICLALVVAIWILAWTVPQAIEIPAAWLVRTTGRAIDAPSYAGLPSRFIEAAAVYLLLMVRWRFLEFAGYALGALLWLVALGRGSRWAARILPFALALGVVELAVTNYGVNPAVPKTFYTYRPPVLDHFEKSSLPYRYADVFGSSPLASVTTEQATAVLNFDSIPGVRDLPSPAPSEFQQRLLLEHGGMLFNEESISNADVDLSFPPELFQFWVYAVHQAPSLARAACLFGRMNVRYQIFGQSADVLPLRQVAPISNGTPHPGYLDENLCFVPRAYIAASARYSPGADETLATLSSPDFDPTNEILVDERSVTASAAPQTGSAGRIESFERTPNRVTLRVNLTRPGYVVLLDRFDPNWHVTVDGREVSILRANLLFRAVRAGPGPHEIRFFYRQRSLRAGLALSLFSLAVAIFLVAGNPRFFRFDRTAGS